MQPVHVAHIDDQISLREFIHPKNTIPAPHTVSLSPPIELSNQFEVLHIEETVKSEEMVDSSGSSETSVHSSLPISEQLKAYARKEKANHEQRKAAPHHSSPSPQSTDPAEFLAVNGTATPSDSCPNPATKRIVCVSESMCRSIRNNFINEKLKQFSLKGTVDEHIHMDLNPGADTEKNQTL